LPEELTAAKSVDDERAIRTMREVIEGGRQIPEHGPGSELELPAARQNLEHAERAHADLTVSVAKAEQEEAALNGKSLKPPKRC
jgi:hypothetical protein